MGCMRSLRKMGMHLLTGGAFGLEGGLLATLLIVLGFYATRVYVKMKAE